ncbi:L-threonylcarbamoyladenylate synthase [Lachnospiraceae bacterium NE2001]|nr:L-threonylcarbamoyladenylate synthase [Lachnospiraceae bacterium NE2001]
MTTQFLSDNEQDIEVAAQIIKDGGLVAFPTETVYGLGGNALSPSASNAIYTAKGRPSDNPLIVHIADTASVYELAKEVPDIARTLMEAFWPGPLTIILPKADIVPKETTGGLDTVAIRFPSHPAAMELIKRSGVYIAAPSANTSGRPSPTTAKHVKEDMDGRIEAIIDGGPVGIGIESTIVDLTSDIPTILRPGFITKKNLEDIIGEVRIDPAIIHPDPNLRPKAPGMKYTHYAPQGELTVVERMEVAIPTDATPEFDSKYYADEGAAAVADTINALYNKKKEAGSRVLILAPEEHRHFYNIEDTIAVGSIDSGITVAARLYAALRECDERGAEFIYSESFKDCEIGGAIMNRLLKAAGQRIIHV